MNLVHNLGLLIMKIVNKVIPKNKKQVLFYSKPDFSDNGRAIYEEFVRQKLMKKYHAVWLVNGGCKELSQKYPDIEFHKCISIDGFLTFARSRYIFRSHMLYGNVRSKNQIVILIWHGMGIKGPMDYFKYKPNFADYITVSSDLYRYRFSSRFKIPPSHCITTGMPRNDFMFQEKHAACLNALPKVVANTGCKTILWMPTYHTNRKSGDRHGKYYELGIPVVQRTDIPRLNALLKQKNIVLLIKLHPHVIGEGSINKLDYSNIQVFDESYFPLECSLYHLLGGVDAMLTDYSSVFTDFMLMNRPLAFIYDDFDEYSRNPGFAFERVKLLMPGQHITSTEGLIEFIVELAAGIDSGREERSILNRFINYYNDAENSLRVLKSVGLIE